jgi:DNA-directed RNA polymerase specialized sigma24 family protein
MEENPNSNAPLWLPKKDKSGSVFRKSVVQAALKNWDRLLQYAKRERIDASVAAEFVESILKSMSTGRAHRAEDKVRNLGSYIYARFTRRIKRQAAKERRIEYVGALRELELYKAAQDWDWPLRLENLIQAKEAILYMDADTRRTYLRRTQGYSWKSIARLQGMSVNSAIKSYTRGLANVRERMLSERGGSESGDRRSAPT